ncbi:hypothetical protein OG613_45805 (plasmid) [Streptomyces sp. NBC_00015]|uniref:hypothetical protein n=1 Tax=unclassified Streptomyces TaxID=2593676 RepID=UPI003250375D
MSSAINEYYATYPHLKGVCLPSRGERVGGWLYGVSKGTGAMNENEKNTMEANGFKKWISVKDPAKGLYQVTKEAPHYHNYVGVRASNYGTPESAAASSSAAQAVPAAPVAHAASMQPVYRPVDPSSVSLPAWDKDGAPVSLLNPRNVTPPTTRLGR